MIDVGLLALKHIASYNEPYPEQGCCPFIMTDMITYGLEVYQMQELGLQAIEFSKFAHRQDEWDFPGSALRQPITRKQTQSHLVQDRHSTENLQARNLIEAF